MTILAWQRSGQGGSGSAVLIHDWAADGASTWQDTGWIGALELEGVTAYVPDLPGHGESADVLIPPDAEPAAWTAAAILNDLDRLRVGEFASVGYIAGCLVAGHLAVRDPERVRRLLLIGCDDRPLIPRGHDIARVLRDPDASLWDHEASDAVSRARKDPRHHLPTLAHWADSAAWPAAPRLGAMRTPTLLAVGRDDPRRERAPRLAALFHDGHLVTVPGDAQSALSATEMLRSATAFLSDTTP